VQAEKPTNQNYNQMKKSIYLFITIVLISFIAKAQNGLNESKPLGLIAYLNTIKEISENKILWSEAKFIERNSKRLELLKNASITDDEKSKIKTEQTSDIQIREEIQNKYATLRWRTSLFINQFSADLIEKNSMSLYRNMDKFTKGEDSELCSKLNKFNPLILEIEKNYNQLFVSKYQTGGIQSLAGTQELFTLAGINPYTIYKDIKASKEKKILALIGYIKEMKMKALSELKAKPKEE
jgi:hypothetical protein